VFTHIWVSRNPVKPPACVKQLVWEPAPPYPGVLSLDFSLEGRYLSTQSGIENWSCMATRGNGWGDYSLRDPIAFQHEAATLLAHGGRPYLSDDNYPSGNPDPAVYRVYSGVNQRTRQLESIVQGCEPVRDVAILLSAKSIWAKLPLTPPRDWMSGPASPAVAGAHKALIETHAQSGILNSDTLTQRLGDYKALVIPEQCLLTNAEADAIRRFVKDGGALIATGDSATRDERNKPLSDFAIADVLGIRWMEQRESRRAYLRIAEDIAGVPRMDIQVTGSYARVNLAGAKSLVDLVPPLGAKQAPSAQPEAPGITLNVFGKGKAIYCAAPLFTAYHQDGTPALGHLAQWMLDTAYPPKERTITLENAPSNVELIYNRRGGTRFVHLVNFTGDKRLEHAQRLHDISPVGRIRVSLRCDRRPREVLLVPENSAVPFEWRDSKLSFMTTPFALHQIWKIQAEEG